MCRNPDIHNEYEKCGIIKIINLIIFKVLKKSILFLSLMKSFNMIKKIHVNNPVNRLISTLLIM